MIEFLSDTKEGHRKPVWSYKCWGEHEGPPIICYVHNPRLEYEDYAFVEYDVKEWEIPAGLSFPKAVVPPDPNEPDELAETADDFYWDVEIRDALKEALMH